MKTWIIRILIAVLVIGAFAAVGFAGYRIGFSHGAQFSGNENAPRFTQPFHRGGMPEFADGFHQRGFHMTPHARGFGLASPFFALIKIALLGLLVWAGYKLFTSAGWQLTFTRQEAGAPAAEPAQESKPRKGKQ